MNVVIMRGIPGAGKSFFSQHNKPNCVCSADDYFIQADGTYSFNKSEIKQAHV